jgi:hypothetical protein
MTKKIIVLAVGILLFNFCFSQENDTVKYKRLVKFPVLTIDNYNNPSSDFTANKKNASIGTNELITQLSFAIPVKKQKTYLFNSIKYNNNTYQSSTNGTDLYSTNVHTFRYIFGLIQALPERWRLTVNLVPNICTDFKEPIGSEDFFLWCCSCNETSRS